MLSFKRFLNAAVTFSGIELMHRIRKGQSNLARLHLKETIAPAVWVAVPLARLDDEQAGRSSLSIAIYTRTGRRAHCE
ncbi:MAG: Integrase catalytic region [Caballeronia mineralivorans]|nr:Integrase catalytic region [Caballeronia mineralivorans]